MTFTPEQLQRARELTENRGHTPAVERRLIAELGLRPARVRALLCACRSEPSAKAS